MQTIETLFQKQLEASIHERIANIKDELASSASFSPVEFLRLKAGQITALVEVIEVLIPEALKASEQRNR